MAVGNLGHSGNWEKTSVDVARETMVQGQAGVKAPRPLAMIRRLVLTLWEIINIWTILSYSVTWIDLYFGKITQTTTSRPAWRESV